MLFELNQEGRGAIEIYQSVPEDLKGNLLSPSSHVVLQGSEFRSLLQEFRGDGFSAWYSRYWPEAAMSISARGGIAVLELRIALKNQIRGKWERIEQAALPVNYFQLAYVPYVITHAIFDAAMEYETFDIHFEYAFLKSIGIDYHLLDQFLKKVDRAEPAALTAQSYPCSPMMVDAVNGILHNSFSPAGKAALLRNNVTNILIAAMELAGKEEMDKLALSRGDIEALYHVRELIEQHCPVYLSNDVLVRKAQPHLNAFKLSYGYKRVFGINPYDYYLQLRFALGKELLRSGHSVASVAHQLEYHSPTTFIKAFRKRFGYTPKQYQLYGD